ncbi:MAG: sodium-independent anion transporter [Rhodospirillales bacterium]
MCVVSPCIDRANSRPHDAILGRALGAAGFHDINDYPGAATVPGLLLYRFDANLVFFNCDYFKARVLHHLDAAATPLEWVVVDASPISIIDYTAVKMLDDLRQELKTRDIMLASARVKQSLQRYFRADWVNNRGEAHELRPFPTISAAIDAFEHRQPLQGR